ncbi:MAG: MobF family relaxase, partial [Acidimicrobiales bacterium]
MLSGVKIGGRHVNYYCAYVAAGGPPGVWLGQGPAALGLGQGVDEGAFRALAKGMAPDGSGPLVRLQANHTMGWDFTFSAPKSVSLLMALHPDEAVRAAVRSAHDEAVEAALGYLEDHGGRSRRGLGGRDGHVKASLVVAGFFHTTSRERDPQLHTHCLVLNVGLGSDGRWATIDSRFLFKRRMAAGAIYRAELRQRLSAMGARWAPPDSRGLSEMVGIERETLRHFSKRRVEIERQLESWGLSGPVASEAATLSTRATKVEVEWAELSAEWRARAQAQGLSPEVLAALMDGSDSREELSGPERARTTEALLGPGGLTATQAAFRRDDVVRAWAAS